MEYLIDTNVIADSRKPVPIEEYEYFVRWLQGRVPEHSYISAITLLELDVGVRLEEFRDPPTGAVFRGWYTGTVLRQFEGRVLSVDAAIAECAAGLHVPDKMPLADSLIAATALVYDLPVVTRNTRDFLRCPGLEVINPWDLVFP